MKITTFSGDMVNIYGQVLSRPRRSTSHCFKVGKRRHQKLLRHDMRARESLLKDRVWSPELVQTATEALARIHAENEKLAAMGPEERAAYVAAWAKRLATEWVETGERGTGCACCDPDVQKRAR
jgi:hypothetical protein